MLKCLDLYQAANGLVSNQFWWFGFSFGLTGFSGKWFEQHTGVVWFSSTTKIIWIGVVWFIFGLTLTEQLAGTGASTPSCAAVGAITCCLSVATRKAVRIHRSILGRVALVVVAAIQHLQVS